MNNIAITNFVAAINSAAIASVTIRAERMEARAKKVQAKARKTRSVGKERWAMKTRMYARLLRKFGRVNIDDATPRQRRFIEHVKVGA